MHPALLPLLARALRPGAEWRIATDDPTYQAWVAEVLSAQALFTAPAPVATRPPGWPPTRYEAKALREGRRPLYWSLRRAQTREASRADRDRDRHRHVGGQHGDDEPVMAREAGGGAVDHRHLTAGGPRDRGGAVRRREGHAGARTT